MSTTKTYVKKNLSLAWPLALNALLMQSMLMIDTLLVSPLGEISLAALGIATTIVAFVMGIQMALANGTQLVISRAVGAANSASVNRGFWAGMAINFVVALLFWTLIQVFDIALISALTDNQSLVATTQHYLSVAIHIVLLNAVTQVIIALFNAVGRTKVPFKGYLIEMPLNGVISYFLIYGFAGFEGFGVTGAALGSLFAIVVRLIFLCWCMKLDPNINVSTKELDASMKSNIANHFKEIFPVAANITMLAVGATIYQLLYSQLNINAYVAITIMMPWIKAGTQFITAWAHSSAISLSQAIGSRDLKDLDKKLNVSIDMAVGISVVSSLFFLILSLFISDIYPDLDESTYTALAVIAPLYIFLPLVRGYNTVHGHALRALGKTTEVFKVNFTGQWIVSIPLCAAIILVFDGSIFWAFAVMPFEEIVKMLPFRQLARKAVKEFDQQKADKLLYD
ncbi:MATE family efflux transporter [Vibrio astriarenae]|uniref:MATE family efflux transporter n=1 Tax=Vibrio astriarenae TaxID=1481923 RepID=UPI003736068B